jgi:uncharacterized OB-fold protein
VIGSEPVEGAAVPDARLRPAPVFTPDSAFFWEGAREERLLAQRCAVCGRLRHPPRPMCPGCSSLDVDIVELSGRGTLYSAVALHYPQHPRFEYPVLGALVDLDEGIRLVTNVLDVSIDEAVLGMRVDVTVLAVEGGFRIPVFRPGSTTP